MLFNHKTSNHEIFEIKNNEAFLGYTNSNGNFDFVQVPIKLNNQPDNKPLHEATEFQKTIEEHAKKIDELIRSGNAVHVPYVKNPTGLDVMKNDQQNIPNKV